MDFVKEALHKFHHLNERGILLKIFSSIHYFRILGASSFLSRLDLQFYLPGFLIRLISYTPGVSILCLIRIKMLTRLTGQIGKVPTRIMIKLHKK